MALGILLGYFVPAVERAFNGVKIDEVSLPIAIGCVADLLTFIFLQTLSMLCASIAVNPKHDRQGSHASRG